MCVLELDHYCLEDRRHGCGWLVGAGHISQSRSETFEVLHVVLSVVDVFYTCECCNEGCSCCASVLDSGDED